MPPGGYFGKALLVDLSTGSGETAPIAAGWEVDADELAATARRIVLAKRLFNLREGWTREEDWLPDRFLSEPPELESGRTATLTPRRFESMISSSALLSVLTAAEGYVIVPEDANGLSAGEAVDVFPYD